MRQINENKFDQIIENMIDTVDKGKDEIYEITEASQEEQQALTKELKETRRKVKALIIQSEHLEKQERIFRNRLAQVSRNFNVYSEEEIKDVYETTHDLQAKVKMLHEREITLRQKRDFIERRLKSLEKVIEKGSNLASKVSVVSNFLNDDFKRIGDLIEDANQKQTFGLKIIEAQEEERRRISREIHDGPAQMLASILLRSELVDRNFREDRLEEAIEEMEGMREMVRSSLYEVRRIIYDLRPMTLDDLGLVPTIRKYLSNTEDYHKITITLSEQGAFDQLASKYEVALFRLIQESVQNAVKHAEPKAIQVNIRISKREVSALIRDDGQGFDLNQKKDQSFGLIGMRERVEMLEGKLNIQSKIGQGTTVYVKIPLNN